MIRTQEATGKTVDEARAKACALLGVQAEDMNVSYEVLEMPQKTGFLGLKLTPAKVRVSVEEPDAPKAPEAPAAAEAPAPAPVEEKVSKRPPHPLRRKLLRPRNPRLRRPPRLQRLLPQRKPKRWKSPSTSKRTPRSKPLWNTCRKSSPGWASMT